MSAQVSAASVEARVCASRVRAREVVAVGDPVGEGCEASEEVSAPATSRPYGGVVPGGS